MTGIKFCSGYHHLDHRYGTKGCEPTDSIAWGTEYWKPPSLENGMMRKMVALSQCCFVQGILGWGRIISGRKRPRLDKVDVTDDHQIMPVAP